MDKTIRILGIAGSLRQASYNRGALRAATQLVPEGATLETFDLDGIPGFNQDDEQNPPAKVAEFKRTIHEADAILIVTPEYNYSIPGVLKNAIDWASRPYGASAWNGKPVAIMGASIGNIATARAISSASDLRLFKYARDQSPGGHDRQCRGSIRCGRESHRRRDKRLHSQVAPKFSGLDPAYRATTDGVAAIRVQASTKRQVKHEEKTA